MKNILITGGAGYIGSHTCKALAQAGYNPITFDNLSAGHKHAVKWGPLEIGDIRDSEALSKVFKKYKTEAVIHFASKIVVSESVREPESYYDNNVNGTLSLLNVMQTHSINVIVSQAPQQYTVILKQTRLKNHILYCPLIPMAKQN